MQREQALQQIVDRQTPWDILIVGGGATGASLLLDAATRGFSAVLLEKYDFGKGTSSRSTKLVHGGVRYLAQGNISLVREALRERSRLRRNAPHVVHEQSFLVPCRNLWQRIKYGIGFQAYDLLAGRNDFCPARSVGTATCLHAVPTLRPDQAAGGVLYSDGQFDDTRLLLDILQTASHQGGTAINYFSVIELRKNTTGQVVGVIAQDTESGQTAALDARVVINATGPFCDSLRQLDSPNVTPSVAASQGVHLVLPKRFLPGDTAVIVPKTSDGRVIFLIPWYDHVLVGTTDTPLEQADVEPRAQIQEVQFLLNTAAEYLTQPPTTADILSVFTGIRPLVRPNKTDHAASTARLSRDHSIWRDPSGMITLTGGKWTTARKMAADGIDRAIQWCGLSHRPCQTADLPLLDATFPPVPPPGAPTPPPLVNGYPLSGDDVVWHARHTMARTVEDVLARRSRLLFLNVAAARQAAPAVADLLTQELACDQAWRQEQLEQFHQTAAAFSPPLGSIPPTEREKGAPADRS